MNQLPQMAFSHIGLYVTDMAGMVSFYTGALGFSVTDRARIREDDVVLLSRSPDEHHQIVLGNPSTLTVSKVLARRPSLDADAHCDLGKFAGASPRGIVAFR